MITLRAVCDRCDAGHENHTMLVIELSNHVARIQPDTSARTNTRTCGRKTISPRRNVNNEYFISFLCNRKYEYFTSSFQCIFVDRRPNVLLNRLIVEIERDLLSENCQIQIENNINYNFSNRWNFYHLIIYNLYYFLLEAFSSTGTILICESIKKDFSTEFISPRGRRIHKNIPILLSRSPAKNSTIEEAEGNHYFERRTVLRLVWGEGERNGEKK